MIVSLPDKDMTIQFPDDMDPKDIERQIMVEVYGETPTELTENESINQPISDAISGGLAPEVIEAIPDPVVRAFAEGRVSALQQDAVEKAVAADPGPERQVQLDNLIAINAKVSETKKVAEAVEKGEFVLPEIAERHPEIIPPKDIIENPGERVVHTMPDGSTMEGPIHEGAVPGSERVIE